MSSEIFCPTCQKRLRVNPQAKSKRLRCPVCQTEMSLAMSGDTVTTKVLATAPVPEPPPLPPPPPIPLPPPAAVEPTGGPSLAADDAPSAEVPPAQPQAVVMVAPRSATSRSRPAKPRDPRNDQAALWIGGGIGLAIVAIVVVGGYFLLGGITGGGTKTTARATKPDAVNKAYPRVEPKPAADDEWIVERPGPRMPLAEKNSPGENPPQAGPPAPEVLSDIFPPAADFSPPGSLTPPKILSDPAATKSEKPEPQKPSLEPEKPAPEKPEPDKPQPAPEPAAEPAKAPPAEKTKPARVAPKATAKKPETKKGAPKGPPPATADCEVCRAQGIVPLKNRQPYVWMEGEPVPKGAAAVREQHCPNCKPDADNAEFAAIEDVRLKTAMEGHLEWEKKTNWQLVRAETRRATIHSQLPAAQTQRVGRALEAMTQHIEGLTGSVELTATSPANCNLVILFQKPNYLAFVELMRNDPVYGPARQEWALVRDVSGTWAKDTIFYQVTPEGPPPEHQAITLLSSFQIREATGYKDPPWLNVGYSAYCENATLKANRVTSLEYALNNLRIDPDWSLAVRRLAAAGGLKTWPDMFPKLLRDYQAEDHLTAYAMVAFLIQYQPRKFLDFIQETRSGLGSAEALEKAYGEKVPELQQRWVKALLGR